MNLLPVVILAGGLATRLRPLTLKIPKSLIEINHVPFIFHQLKLLESNNIKKVIICTGFLSNQIVKAINNTSKINIDISFVNDGPTPLGTAGAIKKASHLLPENFFVLYGDSYLPCDYLKIQKHFIESNKLALMTIYKNDSQWDKSNIEYNNKILNYDKKIISGKMK
ncbi:sugar phosphate nucleotidyltransferase, partial [Gammaproteobacteria bacterium]|nr:sugar phosphate nucleotidyltransferase [Gammaproteobacteria bacterium]